jgi:hypothetical protein
MKSERNLKFIGWHQILKTRRKDILRAVERLAPMPEYSERRGSRFQPDCFYGIAPLRRTQATILLIKYIDLDTLLSQQEDDFGSHLVVCWDTLSA